MPNNLTHRASSDLTPKQRKAVEALLTTGEVSGAAEAAGVSRDTVYRWLKAPAFLAAVREAEARGLRALERVWAVAGCRACRDRPSRVYLFDGDQEPSLDCPVCGRRVVVLVRRYVLVPDIGEG